MKIKKVSCRNYNEALKVLKQMEEHAEYVLSWKKLVPNRLYQLYDKRIFVVYFNFYYVIFCERDKIEQSLKKNGLPPEVLKKKFRLDYITAMSMVSALGADTGSNEVLEKKNPVPGRLYRRKQP